MKRGREEFQIKKFFKRVELTEQSNEMCDPCLEADVFGAPIIFLFYCFKFLDIWENLNMHLGNTKELLLMLSDKIMAVCYVRKCPLFIFIDA